MKNKLLVAAAEAWLNKHFRPVDLVLDQRFAQLEDGSRKQGEKREWEVRKLWAKF